MIPDRETQNDVILATLGRLMFGEWGQMVENLRCLAKTGTVVSDPAVRIRKKHLAPEYAGKPEGNDFAPSIEDALEKGQSFDREDPLVKAYLFGELCRSAYDDSTKYIVEAACSQNRYNGGGAA